MFIRGWKIPCQSVFIRGWKIPCQSVFIRGWKNVFFRGKKNNVKPQENCQDFSWFLGAWRKFDRKSRGEILKFERRNLEDWGGKFAVKPVAILNPLIIKQLENHRKFGNFVKIFHNFYTQTYPPIFNAKKATFFIKNQCPSEAIRGKNKRKKRPLAVFIEKSARHSNLFCTFANGSGEKSRNRKEAFAIISR